MNCGTENCGSGCGGCSSGVCGSCGGCGGALFLTQPELDMLFRLAQIPFLPVARRADSMQPVYLEENDRSPEEYGAAITGLYQKRLIQLDFDLPLTNFDYAAYQAYPHRGSIALTAMGQRTVEQLEIQGIDS